jgi:ubiquinone/menaquinone biosynthesis C-methylase UbiE
VTTTHLLALLLLVSPPAAPPPAAPASPSRTSRSQFEAGRDRYRNPPDIPACIAAQEDPARDRWQKPDQVVQALALRPGQTVCDIGSGPGYFTLRLAGAVGPQGRVFAVDVDPRIVGALRDRVEAQHLRNITPVLGLGDDPLLPPATCDLILIVDTYHHFPDRPAYLRKLASILKPAGRVANIDFHRRATPLGPPQNHRIAREDFVREAAGAGYQIDRELTFLENQYFIVLRPVK